MGGEAQRWEHRVIAATDEQALQALGAEGWELVGVDGGKLYLKRPALPFRERVTLEQKARYYALWQAEKGAGS